jgi:uncharacterized lipoprotein YddW (UPF0748 family)
MKKYIFLCLVSCIVFACSGEDNNTEEKKNPDIPTDVNTPGDKVNKPVQLWIDAHANFSRLSSKANVTTYLGLIKETGFTEIYLDVKPGIGHALYDSDILPKLTKWGSEPPVNRDWDYLGFFIEEAEKLGISVIASISALGYGVPSLQEGPIYESNRWDGKTQMKMIFYDPNNIVDIRTETAVNAAMLDPSLAEVQTFVISIVAEIAAKYPKLKGICLDYCRWYDGIYGFSNASITAFGAYIGQTVTNRNDIITSTGGAGPLYSKWVEFRSMAVTNLVTNIRTAVKAIRPNMEIHLWAEAHWGSRYQVGQNWASKRYTPSGYQYTSTYAQKTSFADQLDVFSLGAYREHVWKSEASGSGETETVEDCVTSYSQYTMGDCKVYGSFFSFLYNTNRTAISDAMYLCLKHTDGVMVFDLSHVVNYNQWGAIKEGINRVMK